MVKEESEESVGLRISPAQEVGKVSPRDSKDSFWSSYPTSELTPEQRRHYVKIMRKEVLKSENIR